MEKRQTFLIYTPPCTLDDTFFWAVLLKSKGANKIRLEAKDLKGHRSYLERTV